MKSSVTFAAAGLALVVGAGLASPAAAGGGGGGGASRPGTPVTVADDLVTPLKLAVDRDGTAHVSQNFAGRLTRIARDGTATDRFTSATGDEVGSVSRRGRTTYFTTSGQDPQDPSAILWALRDGSATPRQMGDLLAHEQRRNPDRRTLYGFRTLRDPACLRQFPADRPATYPGIVESHPYATLPARGGVFVADAAANAILWVDEHSQRVSTVAVMPAAEPVRATPALLAAQGLPACAAGYPYWFEGVPTDIEESPDGRFYVTSLPGGPEDASLGARGAVHELKVRKGAFRRVAGGFVGAVDVAAGPNGQLAVAELFGGPQGAGQVTLLTPRRHHGYTRSTLALRSAAAVEWLPGRHGRSTLWATHDAFVMGPQGPQAIGKVVRVDMRDRWHRHGRRHR